MRRTARLTRPSSSSSSIASIPPGIIPTPKTSGIKSIQYFLLNEIILSSIQIKPMWNHKSNYCRISIPTPPSAPTPLRSRKGPNPSDSAFDIASLQRQPENKLVFRYLSELWRYPLQHTQSYQEWSRVPRESPRALPKDNFSCIVGGMGTAGAF